MPRAFTAADVPDQSGRTIAITGANSGIGFEAAKVLAARGARVLLCCRSLAKADDAAARIRTYAPDAELQPVVLELGDLASVHAAAARIAEEPHLDVLINNAGVLAPPLGHTVDGFELQLGINHLGPFALTGLLLPKLTARTGSRVVNTASNGHRMGRLDFDDLGAERTYRKMPRYGTSKLCNLLHTFELDRRLRAAGAPTISVACHPGGADTNVARHLPWWVETLTGPVGRLFINTAAQGAWPTLLAATHPNVESGQYFGPSHWGEMRGPAREVQASKAALDEAVARRLWEVSVALTGVDPGL